MVSRQGGKETGLGKAIAQGRMETSNDLAEHLEAGAAVGQGVEPSEDVAALGAGEIAQLQGDLPQDALGTHLDHLQKRRQSF